MTKSPNHAEEGELAEVEYCSGRKRPCEEEDHRGGRARVKSEESLESHFEMVVNCIKLLHAKHKGSESAEEDRLGIQLLNLERSCRIATVATRQATR